MTAAITAASAKQVHTPRSPDCFKADLLFRSQLLGPDGSRDDTAFTLRVESEEVTVDSFMVGLSMTATATATAAAAATHGYPEQVRREGDQQCPTMDAVLGSSGERCNQHPHRSMTTHSRSCCRHGSGAAGMPLVGPYMHGSDVNSPPTPLPTSTAAKPAPPRTSWGQCIATMRKARHHVV